MNSQPPPQWAISETLPAFDEVRAGADGHLWVRAGLSGEERLAALGESTGGAGNRWSVFDRNGRWLGDVETPPGLTVQEFGPDYLLGIWSDALGVPYVHLHRLVGAGS